MAVAPTLIAIAIVEDDDCFLVGLRPEGKSLSGSWEFPGGRVEVGETPAAGAVRECREETGLEVQIIGSYGGREHRYEHDHVQLHFFACCVTGPDREATEPFVWVERERLRELQFPAANAALLKHLLQSE